MRPLTTSYPPTNFIVTKATMAEFPALNGQSDSYVVLQYPTGSVNPFHTHPRATELLFLTYGILEVGFVDTTNKLFTQRLQAGDIFMFPKGLVHNQFNCAENDSVIAVSTLSTLPPLVQNTCALLKASRYIVLEAEKVEVILASLPSDFDAVLTLASFSLEALSFQQLVNVLWSLSLVRHMRRKTCRCMRI
ncbi:hypothetical protein Gotri_022187 [Gossypium trilobum]|uniref:Germin-like protein n=1 Tax=Gossypium trilobum TaxID=34281 RepID=A0A7J9DEX8_9ROSI|nr:hypothetical protein [Gossypium trilobum]